MREVSKIAKFLKLSDEKVLKKCRLPNVFQ